MADSRVTDFTLLTGANLAAGDTFHVIDISDTTDNAAGSGKKTTLNDIDVYLGTASRAAQLYLSRYNV